MLNAQCSMLNALAFHISLGSFDSSEGSRSSLTHSYWQKQLALDNTCVHSQTNAFLTKTIATKIPLIVPAMMLGGSPSQAPGVCPMVSRNVRSVQTIVHQIVTVAPAVQEVHVFRCHVSAGPRAHMGSPHCLPLLCSFPFKLNDLQKTNCCCFPLKLNDLMLSFQPQ